MPRTDRNQLKANLLRRVDKRWHQLEKLKAENKQLEKGIKTLAQSKKDHSWIILENVFGKIHF